MLTLVSVFLETVAAIAQVFLLVSIGAVLARAKILDRRGRKTVSDLSYHVFIPALSFARLAGAEGAAGKLWFLLLNIFFAISVATAVGSLTSSLAFGRRRRDGSDDEGGRRVVAAAAAFGNMANLPLVLVQALCSGETARAALMRGAAGSVSSSSSSSSSEARCAATAQEYVMAPIAVASVMQFVLAEAILTGKGSFGGRKKRGSGGGGGGGGDGRGDSPSSELVPLRREQEEGGAGEEAGRRRNSLSATATRQQLLPPSPFEASDGGPASGSSPPRPSGNAAAASERDCVSIDMEPEEEAEQERAAKGEESVVGGSGTSAPAKLLTRSSGSKQWKAAADGLEEAGEGGEAEGASPSSSTSRRPSFPLRVASAAAGAAREAASPPAVASLLGLLVGSAPALRALFFVGGAETAARTPPLALLSTVCETLGGAMIPCLIIVLGAELASGPEGAGDGPSPLSSPSLPSWAIAAALASRLVVMPCLGAAFLSLATRAGLLSPGKTSPPEPLFRVVALLAWGTPAAAMLSTLCSRLSAGSGGGSGGSGGEGDVVDGLGKKMAVLLTWNYAASAATLPLLVSAAMSAMT